MNASQQEKFMRDLRVKLKQLKKLQDIWPLTKEEEKALNTVMNLIDDCL